MAKACQLFSGSSGNSIFIADGETKILVDAGVTAKRLEGALASIGENANDLTAVFITHEHSDHIKGLRVFAARHHLPVIAEEQVLIRLLTDGHITEQQAVTAERDMELGGLAVLPFENSHDSVACLGYRFNLSDGKSISVCTDTGYITPDAELTVPGSDLVFLESNHEIRMLQNGPYPYLLKQRILSRVGHLSNDDCARFAAALVDSGTTRLVLSHLSRENNFPDIARQTTLAALNTAGFREDYDFRLKVAAPENREKPIIL